MILVGAPLFWSGPIRAVFRLSLPVALFAALLPCAALLLALWPALRQPDSTPRRERWLHRLALGVAALFAFALLYNHWFGGLLVIVDGDSGTHVSLRDQFASSSPREYAGFVSFYALTWWLERLVPNAFVSFATFYYVAVVLYAMVPLCAAATTWQQVAAPRRRTALVATTLLWCALLYLVALPLFHYHQAEGFFVHVFGITPLLGIWLVDGLIRPPRVRLLCFLLGVVAYRFTYGLNLGDLLIASAVVVVLEARRFTARRLAWPLFGLTAIALVIAGRYCYQQLSPLWQLDGWIIPPDLRKAVVAEWLLITACVLPLTLPSLRARLRDCDLARWVRLPVLFGVINASVTTWMLRHPPPKIYYLAKYNLHALWLILAAALVVFAALVGAAPEVAAPGPRRWRTVAGIGIVLATLGAAGTLWWRAIVVYRPGFVERAFGHPPFRILHPLADLGAWHRIERVLRRENKQFGGYLTTYYPVMNFMNAAFGFPNGGIHFYYGRAPREGAGYCDFWESGPPSTWLEGDFPQRQRRQSWNLSPDKQCVSYRAHWNPQIVRTLCWLCR